MIFTKKKLQWKAHGLDDILGYGAVSHVMEEEMPQNEHS